MIITKKDLCNSSKIFSLNKPAPPNKNQRSINQITQSQGLSVSQITTRNQNVLSIKKEQKIENKVICLQKKVIQETPPPQVISSPIEPIPTKILKPQIPKQDQFELVSRQFKRRQEQEKDPKLHPELYFNLYLTDEVPRKKYFSRKPEEKEDIIHWGQRKLLLVEIWFLTTYGHLSQNIIYAGAAPGQHIYYLSLLFKNHHFFLYDPNEFKLVTNKRIKIFQKYFTEKDAQSYFSLFNGDYLFISDIRTANFKEMTSLENEEHILQDNFLQMQWIEIMQPKKAILKFRCVYPTEITSPTQFFKGDILIQPWAPQSSTETRLIPSIPYQKCYYDNIKYEEQMFYHNDVRRKESFNDINGKWDQCAEWAILAKYIQEFNIYQGKKIEDAVEMLSERITDNISNGQKLLQEKNKQHLTY